MVSSAVASDSPPPPIAAAYAANTASPPPTNRGSLTPCRRCRHATITLLPCRLATVNAVDALGHHHADDGFKIDRRSNSRSRRKEKGIGGRERGRRVGESGGGGKEEEGEGWRGRAVMRRRSTEGGGRRGGEVRWRRRWLGEMREALRQQTEMMRGGARGIFVRVPHKEHACLSKANNRGKGIFVRKTSDKVSGI